MDIFKIERIANEFLYEYGEYRIPVDVSSLARIYGFRITVADIGAYGVVIPLANTILLKNNMSPQKIRFTVAHELGHVVLNHKNNGWETHINNAIFEEEADIFATFLLIPNDTLKHQIDILSPDWEGKINILADRFNVSTRVMKRRLEMKSTNYSLISSNEKVYDSTPYPSL